MTLQRKWDIDNNMINSFAITNRLYSAIHGAIIGDCFGTAYRGKARGGFQITELEKKDTWSGITVNLLNLMQGLTKKQDALQSLKPYDATDLITFISPLAFVQAEKFDFPLLIKTVEEYAAVSRDNACSRLGCIIYLEILFRLYHNTNFDEAIDDTIGLCNEYLPGTVYEKECENYKRIFNKTIKKLSEADIYSDDNTVHILEAALWSCMNTYRFQDAIVKAVNLGGATDSIGTLTGTMAGLHYRDDWSNMLPKTKFKYKEVLEKFKKHLIGENK